MKDTACIVNMPAKKQETEIHSANTKQRIGPQWSREMREAW